MYRIGIDLGGTKIEGVVLNPGGAELHRKRIGTEREGGYRHILERIRMLHDELAMRLEGQPYTFGIGTPGAISPSTGLLKNSNTTCLNHQPLQRDLEQLLGRPIAIQNDANCFAMAEALLGAGKGYKLVFGVIMGTGCGGGIVHRGEVITGPQAIAGEWGHTSIDPNGPKCYCGQRGCVESYISGGGLEARYFEKFGEQAAFSEIARRYLAKDNRTLPFMAEFFHRFGRAMANLINTLDPDVVVIGGGVSNFEPLYQEGIAEVARQVFSDSLATPIVRNSLGDSAGVLGAAMIGI